METKGNVILIGISAKPYDFVAKDGKQVKGTSYRATLSSGGEVFVVRTDDSVFTDVGNKTNLAGEAEIKITNWEQEGKIEVRLFLTAFNYKG